ncbi:MAG: methyltransferase domain-containing protein [Pseudomonadota bacterium]
MTDAPPQLIDRAAWLARRAKGRPAPGDDFLHLAALESVEDRLSLVARRFEHAALVWPGAAIWGRLAAHPSIDALEMVEAAEDETLPLAAESLDLAVLGLTLHWANDPVGVLIQLGRALKPDGLLLAATLGGETLRELRAALAEAETMEEGGLSPRVSPMGEVRALGALLQRAGFAMPVADAERIETTYADAFALMRDLRAMGESNALADRRRRVTRRATLARAAAVYADAFPAEPEAGAEARPGRVRATFEIIMLTGWAPGPNQPVPKRPGSASARLADALGVPELKAGEKAGR